ncbi:hypothetical protein [Sphingobacterium multivorum]|uniref:hypothetical protein n=1 Tax=Sphingobacterium multivorum TaxID=28454 RepID=UPI0028AED808|nr:hypothetical protein [Sphingobacterium multivorum]
MKIKPEDQSKVIAKLNEVWKNKTCEICQTGNWNIDETIYQINEFHGGNVVIGSGSLVPVITLTCQNCGNTKMLNAIKLGVVEPNNHSED